jgi:bifunctional N-acetylglucosamine-1-phosphate-uridyltransferase/glucosamine-1-phosphate-acetyltransferase GlmU-like protein
VTWRAVVSALDDGEAFRSRVSMYLHPLAGRPVLWHVLAALFDGAAPPSQVRVLHRADTPLVIPDLPESVVYEPVTRGQERRALRAAVGGAGHVVLVDGVAALLTGATFGRLLRVARSGVASIPADQEHLPALAVAGDGPTLATAEDPRHPRGGSRVATATPAEQRRIVDRHSLAEAGVVVRDRLVRHHEDLGVSFILPATVWLDVDVRIGTDSVIYPGVVLEGATIIGAECVIGPYSRIVEASIGRGVELAGWNHVQRTTVRNQAVLEPYARRGLD